MEGEGGGVGGEEKEEEEEEEEEVDDKWYGCCTTRNRVIQKMTEMAKMTENAGFVKVFQKTRRT